MVCKSQLGGVRMIKEEHRDTGKELKYSNFTSLTEQYILQVPQFQTAELSGVAGMSTIGHLI